MNAMPRLPTLNEVQEAFQRYVLSGDSAAAERLFARNGRATVAVRMGIYHDAYRLRLIEALRSDYPTLHALLGAETFEPLARAYIDCHRSPYYNIRWYGDALADFLLARSPWREQPWLAELARFEWSMLAAFDAPGSSALTAEAMSRIAPGAWPEVRFTVQPSVRVLALAFETPSLWKAHKAGEDVKGRRPAALRRDWLIWRRGQETYFRSLAGDERRAFRCLLDGAPFAAICEQVGDTEGDAALRAASLLKTWISEELLSEAIQDDA
ncbi:MAG: HvfC/BufC N-terminal domain-containing protein [Chromatiales bacterium]